MHVCMLILLLARVRCLCMMLACGPVGPFVGVWIECVCGEFFAQSFAVWGFAMCGGLGVACRGPMS